MSPEKLQIYAYSDEQYTSPAGTYTVQINPESFSQTHTATYNPAETTDTAGTTTKYSRIDPETLTFSFFLDGTGVVSVLQLTDSIKTFKKLVYRYNGQIHSPNYLLLIWGEFSFKCRLTQLEIDYTLFDADGVPLRAKLTPHFQQYLSPDDLAKISGRNSPDMTHLRQVMAGDTLPLMCQRIYGNSGYYLMVANYNGLTRFRRLEAGQFIVFPPL